MQFSFGDSSFLNFNYMIQFSSPRLCKYMEQTLSCLTEHPSPFIKVRLRALDQTFGSLGRIQESNSILLSMLNTTDIEIELTWPGA